MNEIDFSKKVANYLEDGTRQIEEPKLARLRAARGNALNAYREPIRVLGLVTVSGRITDPSYIIRKPLFWLPILAIAAAVVGTQMSSTSDDLYDESGAIDAKLLTGELPVDAFLDNDFAAWVKEKEAATQPTQ
jgi:hypothetical protein